MRPLPSLAENRLDNVLERLIILSTCKEAMDAGVSIGSIPKTLPECRTIIRQLIQNMRPEMNCIVRYYDVREIRYQRLSVKGRMLSFCPWAIQLRPIGLPPSSVSIYSALKLAAPCEMRTTTYRDLKGIIGDYCKDNNFALSFKLGNNGVDVLLTMTPLKSGGYMQEDVTRSITRMRDNLTSPVAFCRAVCMAYDLIKEYRAYALEKDAREVTIRSELKALYDVGHEEAPAVKAEESELDTIFKGNLAERRRRLQEAISSIGAL